MGKTLWLALKSLYLWYLEQLLYWSVMLRPRCDWLSKVCTFGIWNNSSFGSYWNVSVVIGSQKFVPLVSGTTYLVFYVIHHPLWLALKSLYLWYLEQLDLNISLFSSGLYRKLQLKKTLFRTWNPAGKAGFLFSKTVLIAGRAWLLLFLFFR